MPYTLNGIGSGYYGKRDFRSDGSFVTTEWLSFLYVPILPFRSLRVRYNGPVESKSLFFMSSAQSYTVFTRTFLNWKQVLYIYGYISLFVTWAIFIVWFFFFYPLVSASEFTVVLAFIACLLPVPIPGILRAYAYKKMMRAP
jgi:hypothetical protein